MNEIDILETRISIARNRQMINKLKEELTHKNVEANLTVWASVKKVFYNSLCNPESEIYKTWYNNGLKLLLSKTVIGALIFSCLAFGLDTRLLAAAALALMVRFGIEVFCEHCKPKNKNAYATTSFRQYKFPVVVFFLRFLI